MLTKDKVIEIFYVIDEFCIEFESEIKHHSLNSAPGSKKRNRACQLLDSEIMSILVYFHFGSYRNFKHYYLFYIKEYLDKEFPNAVSYNRFIELQARVAVPLMLFLNMVGFSAKIDVDTKSKLWDVQLGRAMSKSKDSIQINRKIDSLKQEIESHYRELVDKQGYVTAELVKNTLLGVGAKQKMFLALFKEHNEEFKLCVGINRVMGSYELFLDSHDRLGHFIKQHYGVDDIALTQINASFIDAFDFYLKTERRMGASTILRHTKVLKKIIKRAILQGSIRKDPFLHYRAERPLP